MDLIITADDFGLTRGINYGIYDACLEGVVNSVSLLVNTKHTDHGIDLIKDMEVSLGLSLNLTYGKPLIEESTLTEFGFLKPDHDYHLLKVQDIYDEFEAQIQYGLEKGLEIDFLTTYDHVHLSNELVCDVIKELASKYKLPYRGQNKDVFICQDFHDKKLTFDGFKYILMQLQEYKTVEMVVHPGFLCGHLINISSYRELRLVEHSLLTSPFIKMQLTEHNILLKTYQDIN